MPDARRGDQFVADRDGDALRGNRSVKRAFDIVAGMPLALLFTPVIVILALVSAVVVRSWPFFVQERLGERGRRFRIVKIRTLPPSTPPAVAKDALDVASVSRWGRFLRRTHLDELPQLWLVVTGRMSLVGPRPEFPELADRLYSPEFLATRTAVRPGCTGLWQISDDASSLICEAPQYDLFYLRHRSLAFDLWILWQTLVVTVSGKPALLLAPGAEDAVARVGPPSSEPAPAAAAARPLSSFEALELAISAPTSQN